MIEKIEDNKESFIMRASPNVSEFIIQMARLKLHATKLIHTIYSI